MFLDTSGILCCVDVREQLHHEAVTLYDGTNKRFTHNYVLSEFVALAAARRFDRKSTLEIADSMLSDSNVEVVWVDRQLHASAMKLLISQLDKSYSLCDAVSFLLMRERQLVEALTTDRHFEQAGFRSLLRK
jgi:predicted nucleic acid-binding protein